MAFAYTVDEETVFGNKRIKVGTFTNAGGDTGGDIVTGLNSVEFIQLQHTGSAVAANAPAVNETLPLASGSVTVVTDDGADGVWFAIGL